MSNKGKITKPMISKKTLPEKKGKGKTGQPGSDKKKGQVKRQVY